MFARVSAASSTEIIFHSRVNKRKFLCDSSYTSIERVFGVFWFQGWRSFPWNEREAYDDFFAGSTRVYFDWKLNTVVLLI